jgi:ureidoglycolate lyase
MVIQPTVVVKMTAAIVVKPLTQQAFSQYGDVIEVNKNTKHFTINDGFSERYHDLAKVNTLAENGRTLINIFRSTPLAMPIAINMMERHPLSSQAFMPLGQQPYLVVVAPQGEFNEALIEVFIARNDQGVNYHAGTWHHYCLALNEVSDFLVIDRGDAKGVKSENCDVVKLDGSKVVDL